ncbi:phage minor tail protein L [Paraburkholderia adhaesiva]|uniref:phage minor tail protein L n=1 Tax=Paraburkholderia adhaesiva TaxID=2883244 RepID=UPI001F288972|nr:phage minor tail protein L [Paraburkholderia adhaesiva]
MNIRGASNSLAPGAVLEFFMLDLSRFNEQPIYFHAGTNKLDSDVTWQGRVYARYPVKAEGFEMKAQGTLPRPTLVVSNVMYVISALCRMYHDLVGARVVRKRTLARYLDAVNFPEGNPTANPDEQFPDDIYFVMQKTREDLEVIEFTLAVGFDVDGVQLPRRQIIRNSCPWRYRGEGCGYGGGPVADVNDARVTEYHLDVCGKRLQSCKLRFGEHAWLPFGGFPGAGEFR